MTAPLSLCHGRHLPSGQAPPSPWPSGTQAVPRRRRPGPHSEDLAPTAPQAPGGAPPPGRRIPPLGSAASAHPRGARPAPLGGRGRRGLPAARKRFPGGHHRRRRLSRRPRRRRAAFLSPLAGKMSVSIFRLRRSQRRPPEPGAFSRGGAQAPGAKRKSEYFHGENHLCGEDRASERLSERRSRRGVQLDMPTCGINPHLLYIINIIGACFAWRPW